MSTNCNHCNGKGVEPEADGLECHVCKPVPSWVKEHSAKVKNSSTFGDVAGATADGVSDFMFWNSIGDIASSAASGIGSGISTVTECTGDVLGAVGECAGDILGAAFD